MTVRHLAIRVGETFSTFADVTDEAGRAIDLTAATLTFKTAPLGNEDPQLVIALDVTPVTAPVPVNRVAVQLEPEETALFDSEVEYEYRVVAEDTDTIRTVLEGSIYTIGDWSAL